ncbi:hypothetical protein DOY81_001926, partial [Sarcophaga bullata]
LTSDKKKKLKYNTVWRIAQMTPFLNNCRHFDNQTKRKEEETKQKATKNQLEKSKVVSKNSLLNNI